MVDAGLGGKVVLITGANHGIGAAAAKVFAAEGAQVFISYLGTPPQWSPQAPGYVDELVQTIRERGGSAEAWEADLADPATIPQLFDRAEEAFGPVDVLVNNAAHWQPDTFLPTADVRGKRHGRQIQGMTAQSHDRHFAVNSRAAAVMMTEYGRRHVERGAHWGRIINVSTDGASGFPSEVSYGASKAALESYSRAAAKELGKYGITVNVVSPGPIQTGYITRDLEERLLPTIPLRRLGQPEDVSDVIVFLASERARWLTGQTLYVGGGHAM